jgi:multidrug resistance efflux pump
MVSLPERRESTDDFPSMQMVRTGRIVRSAGRITFICLCVATVAMLFVPWQQTAKGIGTVLALDPQERPQPILSPSEGVVSFVQAGIREGSYVEKGQLVLRLTPFAAGGVDQIAAQIDATESALAAQKLVYEVAKQNVDLQVSSGKSLMQSLEKEVEASKEKWEQTKNEVSVLQADLKDKENQLRIAKEVAEQGLISREELFTKFQSVDAQYNKTLQAESKAQEAFATLTSKEQQLESKREDINIKNREAKQKEYSEEQKVQTILKNLSELRNKGDEFNRLDVVAPRAGFIQQWYGLEGSDTVKKGDQLFQLVPDTEELAVEMKVSGNDMPLLHVGDRVRLQFEGWPAVQFVGWPSVAVGTFGGEVNRVFPTDDGNGNFRVVVTPDNHFAREDGWPDNRYLRQGVRANGWVLLKQVPLGYEIWRQLNGFPPIVADQEPGKPKDKASKVKLPKL